MFPRHIVVVKSLASRTADRLTQRVYIQENETAAVMNEKSAESGRLNSWDWEVSEGHRIIKIPASINTVRSRIKQHGWAAGVAVHSETTTVLPCAASFTNPHPAACHSLKYDKVWCNIFVIFSTEELNRSLWSDVQPEERALTAHESGS